MGLFVEENTVINFRWKGLNETKANLSALGSVGRKDCF